MAICVGNQVEPNCLSSGTKNKVHGPSDMSQGKCDVGQVWSYKRMHLIRFPSSLDIAQFFWMVLCLKPRMFKR